MDPSSSSSKQTHGLGVYTNHPDFDASDMDRYFRSFDYDIDHDPEQDDLDSISVVAAGGGPLGAGVNPRKAASRQPSMNTLRSAQTSASATQPSGLPPPIEHRCCSWVPVWPCCCRSFSAISATPTGSSAARPLPLTGRQDQRRAWMRDVRGHWRTTFI